MKEGNLQMAGMELERIYRGNSSFRDTYVESTYSINKGTKYILETI